MVICKIDHCIHIRWCIPWDLNTMILGLSHTCDLNRCGVKSHLGVNDLWFKFLQKGHCIHILWCIFMGHGHNDPWVESHMWPQKMWGQRSSRGQWPLVQVFAKRVTVSTYFDVCSGETHGSWTTLCSLPLIAGKTHRIALSTVVVCKNRLTYLLALTSTCFDAFQPKLGHRCNMGTLINDLLMRSKVTYQGQRSSEVKL